MAVQTDEIPMVPGPIISAGSRTIPEGVGTPPIMRESLSDWFRPIEIIRITNGPTVDGKVTQVRRSYNTSGVMFPTKPREIDPQPAGVRAWGFQTLYVEPEFEAAPNDQLEISQVLYRVVGTYNWSGYGFREYHLTTSYQ